MQLHIDYLASVARGLKTYRKRYFRGNRSASLDYAPGVSGWKCVGTGHFSNVWMNPNFPGVAIKVAGRGEFNGAYYFNSGKKHNEMYDMWVYWAQLCMKYHDHVPGLPKIYSIERTEGGEVCMGVMKAYTKGDLADTMTGAEQRKLLPCIHHVIRQLDNMGGWQKETVDIAMLRLKHNFKTRLPDVNSRMTNMEWRFAREFVALVIKHGARIDYHGSNRMIDEHGKLVVTDPVCASAYGFARSEYGVRSDKVESYASQS